MKKSTLETQLNNDKDRTAYLDALVADIEAGRNKEAIIKLEKYLCVFPDDGVAHSYLAKAYSNSGNLDKALHHLRRASALRPDEAVIQCIIGSLELQNGNVKAACKALRQAIAIDAKNQTALSSGTSSVIKGLGKRGIDCLRKDMLSKSNEQDACFGLALELDMEERIAEAIQAYDRVIAINPHSTYADVARVAKSMLTNFHPN